MVDLPIPTPQNVTSQAPNPMVTAGDIARSGGYIATGLDKLAAGIQARGQGEMERGRGVEQEGQGLIEAGAGYQRLGEGQKALGAGLEEAAVPFAEQAGRNSVTRNADGSISAAPSFIMGRAGEAYAAAQQGMMGPQIRSKIDEDLTNIRNQFPGDVAGFKAAADHYLSVNQATYGNNPVGAMAQGYATGVVAQHFNSIADQASRSSFEGGAKAQDARIDWLNNAINGASGDGAGQSKQVSQWMAERSSLLDSKVANPLYQYTPAMRSVDDQLFAQSNQVAGWTGQARAMYQQTGNLSAARDFMEKKLDTMEGLSEIQKIRYMGEVSAHLRGVDAVRQQQNQQYKDQADTLITEAKAAGDVDPTRFGTMAQTLNSKRLFAKAAEVTTAGIFQGYQPAILGGTAQESTAALNAIKDQASRAIATGPQGAPAGSGDRAAYLQRVREIENPSGDPNATSPTGAKGIYQFIQTTWAAYGGGGDITNPADQEKAAGRLTDANQASLQRSLGRAPTSGELYLAHQQGAGGAAQLLANPTARAGDIVGDKAIAVNGGDPNASAAAFTNMWVNKFEKGMGPGASPADTDVAPAYNALLRETYAAYNVHAQRLWDGIKNSWEGENGKKGYQPSPSEMADLKIMAPNVTDPKLRLDIQTTLQKQGALAAFTQQPLQQQQDHLAALQLVAQQGGADNVQRQVIGALGEQVAHQVGTAKEDPVSYAQWKLPQAVKETMAPVLPLNLSSADTFVQGLQARQAMKTTAQKFDPAAVGDSVLRSTDRDDIVNTLRTDPTKAPVVIAGLSTLKPPELAAALQDKSIRDSVMPLATVDQKLALLSPLSQLPEVARNAAFKEIGGDKDGEVYSMAGSVNGHDPEAARSILTGQALMKQEPRLAPKTDDRQTASTASLPSSDFGTGARGAISNAAEAYYAKLSADAGDVTANFDQNRWNKAVDAVTGGVVDYRGAKVIVPKPGMSQSDFSNVVSKLTDADLQGSRTASGVPLPASALQPSMFGNLFGGANGFRLQSFGDGKYLIFSGANNARAYLRTDILDPHDRGGPFVLDLKAKADTLGPGT